MVSSANTSLRSGSDLKRNSSMEILRIIAMVMIVFSHCSVHDCFPEGPSAYRINNYILDWCVLGNLGVDIFLLISGYFLSEKDNPRKSAVRLWAEVWFYSLFCSALYWITGHPADDISLKFTLFPTIFNQYWFFTAYVIFLFLTPYVNLIIGSASRQQLCSCILIMAFFWSVLPVITQSSLYGDVIPTFLLFYLIGAYFRKYPDNLFSRPGFRKTITLAGICLLFLSSVVSRTFGNRLGPLARPVHFFYSRTSILALFTTVGIFSLFVFLPKFHRKWINWIGSCTFGIYLFHDNNLIRSILWSEWLPKYDYYHSKYLFAGILLSAGIVMAAGILIESLRKLVVEKPLLKLVTCFTDKLPPLPDGRI